MTAQTPGQAAYEAFRKAFPGEDWGPWDSPNVSDIESRDGWKSVAQAAIAAQEQPAPELAEAERTIDRYRDQVTRITADSERLSSRLTAVLSGILGLAADLDRSAAETRPSRKSEIEAECAIAPRRLLETP